MLKNEFMIYNELIAKLYACQSAEDLLPKLLLPLKMLIPFSYASIFLTNPQKGDDITDLASSLSPEPICCPAYFTEAERNYLLHINEDRTLWLIQSHETSVVRESDLFSRQERQSGAFYDNCYKKFQVDDIMHITMVQDQNYLGILSLFRTEADGCFSNEDVFYLRSLGVHLNAVFERIQSPSNTALDAQQLSLLQEQYALTSKELDILNLIFHFQSQEDITSRLSIRPNTLQKHMQNIFRKMNVSSRWELLKFRK